MARIRLLLRLKECKLRNYARSFRSNVLRCLHDTLLVLRHSFRFLFLLIAGRYCLRFITQAIFYRRFLRVQRLIGLLTIRYCSCVVFLRSTNDKAAFGGFNRVSALFRAGFINLLLRFFNPTFIRLRIYTRVAALSTGRHTLRNAGLFRINCRLYRGTNESNGAVTKVDAHK